MVRKILTKNIFVLRLLAIILIVFIGCELVNADFIDPSGGEDGEYNLGSGSWNTQYVGLKMGILNDSNDILDVKLILNNNRYSSNYKFSEDFRTKNLQNKNIRWESSSSMKGIIEFDSSIPRSWTINSNGSTSYINIYEILQKDNYTLLKSLLNKYFSKYLSDNYYVIVEPMAVVNQHYGTAFELANAFLNDYDCGVNGSFCWMYGGAMFANKKNGAFYTSIFVKNNITIGNKTFTPRTTSNDCFKNNYCGSGMGIFRIFDIYPEKKKAKLTINKVNSVNKRMITSSPTTFEIYNSSNCSGKVVKTVKTSGGTVNIELDKGTYSIKEVGVPSGYEKPKDNCVIKSITLNLGDNKTQTVTNEPNCNTRLADLGSNPSKESLNSLYKLYPKLNGLLNFSNPSCTAVSCNYSKNISCLSGNFGSLTFNQNNVSCYNETIDVNGNIGYCLTTFNLVNKLGNTNFFAKSGMMPINKDTLDNALAATGMINKKCLVLGSRTPNSSNIGKYSEYISNIKFDDRNLYVKKDINKISDTDKFLTEVNHSGNWYEYSHSVNYYLNKVYATKKDGKILYEKCPNCIFLGYGIVSKLTDSGTEDIPFSIKFTNIRTKTLGYTDKDYTNKCKVTLTPELVKDDCDPKKEKCDDNNNGKLNLEFRLIDSSNPFPGKSGNGRKVGSNWCSGTDCKNNNDLIKNIISNRTNSYGKIPSTGAVKNPIYKITLTPDTINKIRDYNKNNPYDDYTLKCDQDGNNCKSTFLEKFGIARLS